MVKIIADTLSCLSVQEANDLGIGFMPQIIEFGEQAYRDDTEMDSATFLQRLRNSSVLPKTAAPPPALYEPLYQEYSQAGHSILVICPSAQMSGTVRSAEVAAQDFPNADIRIIDTYSIGPAMGSLVRIAVQMAQEGFDADAIEVRLKTLSARIKIFFMVDTLEFLQRGGRIGKAQALVGSLLQVKPILTICDGHTETVESQRTKRKALARVCEIVKAGCPRSESAHLALLQGDAMADATFLAEEFKQSLGMSDIPIYFLPPAILVHAGPGALGVTFFSED